MTGLAFSPDDAMHCVAQGRRGSADSGYRSGAALLPAGHVDNHFNGGRAAAFGNQRGKLMGPHGKRDYLRVVHGHPPDAAYQPVNV